MITASVDLSQRTQGYFRTLWNRLTPTREMRYVAENIVHAASQKDVRLEVGPDLLLENGNMEDLFPGSQHLAAALYRAGVTEVVVPKGATVQDLERDLNALTDRSLPVADRLLSQSGGSIKLTNQTHKVPFTWTNLTWEMGWQNLSILGTGFGEALEKSPGCWGYSFGPLLGGFIGAVVGEQYQQAQHFPPGHQGSEVLVGVFGGVVGGLIAAKVILFSIFSVGPTLAYFGRSIINPFRAITGYRALRSFASAETVDQEGTERARTALGRVREQFRDLYLRSLTADRKKSLDPPPPPPPAPYSPPPSSTNSSNDDSSGSDSSSSGGDTDYDEPGHTPMYPPYSRF